MRVCGCGCHYKFTEIKNINYNSYNHYNDKWLVQVGWCFRRRRLRRPSRRFRHSVSLVVGVVVAMVVVLLLVMMVVMWWCWCWL